MAIALVVFLAGDGLVMVVGGIVMMLAGGQ
jgi:hypothetical protein